MYPACSGADKHESRSDRYTHIPTITILESLQREGFEPSLPARQKFATRASGSTPSIMLRLRRSGQLESGISAGKSFFYLTAAMGRLHKLPDAAGPVSWRVCACNGPVCGQSFGEVRVPA